MVTDSTDIHCMRYLQLCTSWLAGHTSGGCWWRTLVAWCRIWRVKCWRDWRAKRQTISVNWKTSLVWNDCSRIHPCSPQTCTHWESREVRKWTQFVPHCTVDGTYHTSQETRPMVMWQSHDMLLPLEVWQQCCWPCTCTYTGVRLSMWNVKANCSHILHTQAALEGWGKLFPSRNACYFFQWYPYLI